MADPLSITASIIAVLQLTQEVIKFCDDIREADSNATRLRNELSSTTEVLYQLLGSAAMNAQSHLVLKQDSGQMHAKSTKRAPNNLDGQLSTPSRTLNMIKQKGGPLDQYGECVSVLKNKLAPQTGIQKAKAAIKWPFQKDEINALVARIERFKTLFMLTQQEDHVCVNPVPRIVAYTLFQCSIREPAIEEFLGWRVVLCPL
jgi:hypothetical protein